MLSCLNLVDNSRRDKIPFAAPEGSPISIRPAAKTSRHSREIQSILLRYQGLDVLPEFLRLGQNVLRRVPESGVLKYCGLIRGDGARGWDPTL